jgi:hypothetical protein
MDMTMASLLRRTATPLAAAAAAVSLGLVAACATSSSVGAGAGAATTGSTAPVDPTGTATFPGTPPPIGASVSEEGTVVEGAEPACLILQTQNGQFELLGTTGVKVGDKVRVSGSVVHVMSHCMQGRPFKVTELTHL